MLKSFLDLHTISNLHLNLGRRNRLGLELVSFDFARHFEVIYRNKDVVSLVSYTGASVMLES